MAACLLACALTTMVFAQKDTILNLHFSITDQLITIEAEVHGIQGVFVLDTGVPGIFLNERYFKESSDVIPTDQVVGINGRARQVGLLVTDIKLEGIRQGVDALVVDLTHIEKSKNIQLLGLIGQCMFKRHELLFDLPNYSTQLIPTDKKGHRLSTLEEPPQFEIPFKTKGHLPILRVEINNLELLFALDTGAECNVIAPKYRDQIKVTPKWSKLASLTSGWRSRQTVAYQVEKMKVFDQNCHPMLSVFSSLESINNSLCGPQLDGIIGMEWLLQKKVSLNFRKKRCYLWKEKLGTKEIEKTQIKPKKKEVN